MIGKYVSAIMLLLLVRYLPYVVHLLSRIREDCLLPLYLMFCTELQPSDQQNLKGLFLHCSPWWLQYKALKISSPPGSKTCTFPHHTSSCQPLNGAAFSVGRPGDDNIFDLAGSFASLYCILLVCV